MYPGTWRATEYEGAWTALDEFDPGAELPGEDVIAPLTLLSFLVVNSMAVPVGTTDEEWLSGFEALVQAGMTDDCPGVASMGTVGGHEATVITSDCDGDIITGRHLVHDGRGYYFTTRWAADDAAAAALLAQVVESIQFAD